MGTRSWSSCRVRRPRGVERPRSNISCARSVRAGGPIMTRTPTTVAALFKQRVRWNTSRIQDVQRWRPALRLSLARGDPDRGLDRAPPLRAHDDRRLVHPGAVRLRAWARLGGVGRVGRAQFRRASLDDDLRARPRSEHAARLVAPPRAAFGGAVSLRLQYPPNNRRHRSSWGIITSRRIT